MKGFRALELVITIAACATVSNAAMHSLFGSGDQLNFLAGNKSLIEVAAGTWLLALVFGSKQLPRIG